MEIFGCIILYLSVLLSVIAYGLIQTYVIVWAFNKLNQELNK